MENIEEDNTMYKVVVNTEEQYSIWFAERENALGWRDEGMKGPKSECLDYIEKTWTDMRPLSLRKHMEEFEKKSGVEKKVSKKKVSKKKVNKKS